MIAACYDTYFAWREQAALDAWEMNPVTRWVAGTLGLQMLIAFKAAGIAYGLGLAAFCHRHYGRLGRQLTTTVGATYLLLCAYYVCFHMAGAPFPWQ